MRSDRLLRRRTDGESVAADSLRALVVDDDADYRTYISALLNRIGFEVTAVEDGERAIRTIDHGPFEIVIVDSEMPRMNGLEVISQVRKLRFGSDVFALMLTSREDLDTKIVALRLGFDDFLLKDASDDEIVAKLGAMRRLIVRQHRLDAAVRELYGLATRDELTGLFNRRYFFAEAERLVAENIPLHLVMFDLDNFKSVNDTYGHLAGDRILRDLGALFVRRTRHEDVFARYGGDEFVLLVTNCATEEVEQLASRLAKEVREMVWTFNRHPVQISVTTGIATSVLLDQPSVARLLNAGDRDLYKNKWVRAHPTTDPALYEYPASRGDELSGVVEFPAVNGAATVRESGTP